MVVPKVFIGQNDSVTKKINCIYRLGCLICINPNSIIMKRFCTFILLSSVIMACKNPQENKTAIKWPDAKAPVAAIVPHNRIIHGDTVVDNYYWMIDYFKKGPDSTNVVDYLKAENAYLDTMMKSTEQFQENLFKEMKGRIKEKDELIERLNKIIDKFA